MLSVSSRFWTRVTVSISYDDNHYTTGTSIGLNIIQSQEYFATVFDVWNLFKMILRYVLRTSIDKIKENGFKLTKERNRRYPAQTITDADDADDIAFLANAPAQAETLLHSLNEQVRALASQSMHTRRNICALIKQVTSPHKTVALWNKWTSSPT